MTEHGTHQEIHAPVFVVCFRLVAWRDAKSSAENGEIVRLRPGEQLYEELLLNEEGITKTDNKKIYIGKPIEFDNDTFKSHPSYY